MKPKFTFIDLFAGIGGLRTAFENVGGQCVFTSEFDPYAQQTYRANFGNEPIHGDITKIKASSIPDHDVLVAGFPCFTAGHMVLTEDGYRPIEDLRVGDHVMTHKGRLREILTIGNRMHKVGRLRAVGMLPIITTPEHPFRSVYYKRSFVKRGGKNAPVEVIGKPKWTDAEDMAGQQWCALTKYKSIDANIDSRMYDDAQAMYIAGMYLGDGYLRRYKGKNNMGVVLCITDAKYAKFGPVAGDTAHTLSKERTSLKVIISDTRYAKWLRSNFNELSHNKTIPAWVMSHPLRQRLLQGVLDTDGGKTSNGYKMVTVSKSLAYGYADLATSCGYVSSVKFVEKEPTTVIEGRTVNQRSYYTVCLYEKAKSRKSREHHGYVLRTVQRWRTLKEHQRVYNIEVADDNSYVVNCAVVHNCQPFSIAGVSKNNSMGRKHGFEDEIRGTLFFDVARIIRYKQPHAFMLENVRNLLSHDGGNTFRVIYKALTDLGYDVHYRVLNGQHFTPQKRLRIVIVGFRKPVPFSFDQKPLPPTDGVTMAQILHRRSEPVDDRFIVPEGINPRYVLSDKLWAFLQGYAQKHKDAGNGFGCSVVGPSDVARTLSARYYKDGSEILVSRGSKNPRKLTPRECARLMGFPDSFVIPVSDTRAYKQFGNSVVVPLMQHVASMMLPHLLKLKKEK